MVKQPQPHTLCTMHIHVHCTCTYSRIHNASCTGYEQKLDHVSRLTSQVHVYVHVHDIVIDACTCTKYICTIKEEIYSVMDTTSVKTSHQSNLFDSHHGLHVLGCVSDGYAREAAIPAHQVVVQVPPHQPNHVTEVGVIVRDNMRWHSCRL